MTLTELLTDVVDVLDAEGIPYMLTGSLASSLWGEPRATNDIEIIDADVISPEDLILSKLAWALETGSDRQRRDVAGMVALVEDLDRAYVARWAARLGIMDAWHQIADEGAADE